MRVSAVQLSSDGQNPLTAFQLGETWLPVATFEDTWFGADSTFFKVRAADGNIYILKHHEPDGAWTLESFRRDSAVNPV